MAFNSSFAVGLLVTSLLSAFFGLLILTIFQRKTRNTAGTVFLENSLGAEYLFDDKMLVEATPVGQSLLPKACQTKVSAWPGLISYLEERFPGVATRLETLSSQGTITMGSTEDPESAPMLLRAELRGGLTRISLLEAEAPASRAAIDPLTRRAIRDELEQLRQISAKAPLPIWRESDIGDVVWANACYLGLVTERLAEDEDLAWPLPKLFDETSIATVVRTGRKKLAGHNDQKDLWFDLFESKNANDTQFYALPADSTVKAEDGLRAFMQTLTKTFAHLSTGLAIFDQERKLVLFNPALIDLTGLSPDLLTKRPSLPLFFDSLREGSMIPEPRDYKSWRNQITDIEEAAATGLY